MKKKWEDIGPAHKVVLWKRGDERVPKDYDPTADRAVVSAYVQDTRCTPLNPRGPRKRRKAVFINE